MSRHQTIPLHTQAKEPPKASVRRHVGSTNPNRRKMSVSVSESFEAIQKVNNHALRILNKRA